MAAVCGIRHPDRVATIFKRDRAGNDLTVLDILGTDAEGVQGIRLGEEMEDLYHVPITQPRKSGAYQEGSTPTNLPRKNERLPRITLITEGRTVADWENIETLLWSVLSTKFDVFLRLYDSAGDWRELRIRLLTNPSDKTKTILGKKPFHVWRDLQLLAWDPFWYSPELTDEMSRAQMTQTDTNTWSGVLHVPNPADQPNYPMWANGGMVATEKWSLSDAGRLDGDGNPIMVDLPDLAAGRSFKVNTYPNIPTLLVLDQSLQWARMKSKVFRYWLDEGTVEPVAMPVKLVGGDPGSTIKLFLPQRWDRPFGGQVIA